MNGRVIPPVFPMPENLSDNRKKELFNILAVYFLLLLVPFVLYSLRAADDNRLTSWQWVFSIVPFSRFLFVFAPAMLLAYIFSRTSFFLTAFR